MAIISILRPIFQRFLGGDFQEEFFFRCTNQPSNFVFTVLESVIRLDHFEPFLQVIRNNMIFTSCIFGPKQSRVKIIELDTSDY